MQKRSSRHGIRAYIGWGIAALCSLGIAISISLLSPTMAPVSPGNVDDLWKVAWGDVGSIGFDGHVHPPRDGVFVYEIMYIHGSMLYSVPLTQTNSDFNRALNDLRQQPVDRDSPGWINKGLLAWDSDESHEKRTAENLFASINEARLEYYYENYPSYSASFQQQRWDFEERWAKARCYWANLVGEWAYLTGLIVLGFWPLIHKSRPLRWSVHFGLIPILFALPVYLGYATFSFTSHGPSGGVLYPWIASLILSGGSLNAFDNWMIAHTPQILEPMSQSIGGAMALTGRGLHGPTTVLAVSIALALCVYITLLLASSKCFRKSKS